MGFQMYVAISLFLLCSQQVSTEGNKCLTKNLHFATESITSDKQGDYLFYGVASEVDSLHECARICYVANFCRSALYDAEKKICKLGYATVRDCSVNIEPTAVHNTDQQSTSTTLIFCVSCDDTASKRSDQLPPASTVENKILEKSDQKVSDNLVLSASRESSPKMMNKAVNEISHNKGVVEEIPIPSKPITKKVDPPPQTATNNVLTKTSAVTARGAPSCYTQTRQHAFIKSAYQVYRGYSLVDCQCTCAQTWAGVKNICSSVQYYPNRQECVLNRLITKGTTEDDEVGDDLIEVRTLNTSLYEFTCGSNRRRLFQYLLDVCSYDVLPKTGHQHVVDCHDIVVGHSLKGVAGALQHDVSIETCRCLCFDSANNEKYRFICRSALYYPKERDCVLNLYDRWQRPDLFQEETVYQSVIYLDASCNGHMRTQLINRCHAEERVQIRPVYGTSVRSNDRKTFDMLVSKGIAPADPAQTAKIQSAEQINEHTDSCFLEVPGYALINSVEVTKTNVRVEDCKCLCLNSSAVHGFQCLSFVYIWNTNTCWLNKFNRVQRPQHFSQVNEAPQRISYFEYLCNPSEENSKSQLIADSRNPLVGDQQATQPKLYEQKNEQWHNDILKQLIANRHLMQHPSFTGNEYKAYPLQVPPAEEAKLPKLTEQTTQQTHTTIQTTTSTATTALPGEESLSTRSFDYSEYVGGSCTYSAFYDAEFSGRNLLDKFLVQLPLHCFVECVKRNCRSANLVLFLGKFKHCYLYGDSAIEYPFTNMITFHKGSVYFEGISCARKPSNKNPSRH
ncbi:PAN 1 domain containing protein [Trichuris trichiura]|uniref:PAN 1 domain containing protein n=1 Tax=Trichuris trichiura TaxID=36087 RepID=A0A077YY03_TRITR|nr:PAN 1 domain containing protein [Trichuris trichiura]